MEDAVTKPTVRRGGGDFTERRSAIVVISGSTIPKLSELANSFGAAFKFMIGERGRATRWSRLGIRRWLKMSAESDLRIFLSCQKPFPASL
jgi:hypothetical protein